MTAAARAPVAAVALPWLGVIGIGDDGLGSLGPAAHALLAGAEVLVGGARQLAMVTDHPAERLAWRSPLEATLGELEGLRGRPVVVLASGDPMCFGVGELLARHFAAEEMRVLPAPSAISLACARLAWSQQEVEPLSLHGRPAELLNRHLAPGARLIVLSHDGETPNLIAATLAAQGWGPSQLKVLEHLGGARERCSEGRAEDWRPQRFAALNTVAIECRAGADAMPRARIPGLPDEAFRSDGMLTRREVRAATLARLLPLPGQCLWDVGAGSGAVAIEWLRATRRGRAVAIERDPARCALVRANAAALGTPELVPVEGTAPGALAGLPAPDAVFVGGGSRAPGLLDACWQALAPGGRLVANVVTVEGERALLEWQARHGGDLVRIEVAHLAPIGGLHAWRPALPVTQLAACRP
jgi:precorrin-6Y C5,15-methyltransferase (decarboxylating)